MVLAWPMNLHVLGIRSKFKEMRDLFDQHICSKQTSFDRSKGEKNAQKKLEDF
jgi:hypothetical protein